MKPWLQYLIAFIVFCHGFVYVRVGGTLPAPIPAWKGSSWLLGDVVTGGRLTALVIALHVIAGVAIIASSAAIVFGAWIPGWWRPLAIGGAAVGLAAFAVFWDGQTQQLFEEGAIGAGVSAALLLGATLFPRAFA
jgi:hypothetical protein